MPAPLSNSGSTPSGAPASTFSFSPAPAPSSFPASVKAQDGPGAATPSVLAAKTATPTPPSGGIDYAAISAQLEQIRQKALTIQDQANKLTKTNTPDTSSFISSSAPAVQNENNIKGTIDNLSLTKNNPINMPSVPGAAGGTGTEPDTSGAKAASDGYIKTIQDYQATLEKRRADEVAAITADYGAQKTKQENAQNSETGSATAMLARTGGYLGASGSATGVLINLARTHADEMTALMGKRDAAIQAANSAIDDKQFAAAQSIASQIQAIDKTINDRKQQFFDDNLKVIQQQQSQDQFQQTKIKDDLTNLSFIDPTSVPDSKKAEIDQFYGVPGFTDKYLAVVNQQKQVKSQQDALTAKKDLLTLLQDIPQGQKVSFPDGTQYTGMGKVGDMVTWLQVDDSGTGHIITYNKATGQQTVTNAGAVGKTKSAGPVSPAVDDAATSIFLKGGTAKNGTRISGLEETKDKNGQYDPDTYLQLRANLAQSYPALVPKMDAKFLSKANGFFSDTAVNYLRQHGVYVGEPPVADPNVTPVAADAGTVDSSVGQ